MITTRRQPHANGAADRSVPRMTQPEAMQTKSYVGGVEKLNGHDAWALFQACAAGDVPRVKALLVKDRRLVNAQHWYQFPIHMAVYAGHAAIVKMLLEHGADPGQSVYTYHSWDKLLLAARERGQRPIEALLQRAMHKKFNYAPEFDALKQAMIARDSRQVSAVLRRQPSLAQASDALGNNALHWSVITRQLGLIERFVELGTPIDAERADGNTPVLLAVNGATDYWYRDTRGRSHPSLRNTSVIVGSLLAQGAGYTISVAAAVGDQERVEELLQQDAGLAHCLDSSRARPLSYAAGAGHLHIVRLLLEHGAEPNQPEASAPSGAALFNACSGNHLRVAQLLLEHGADPNAGTDSNGCCLTIGEVFHGEQAKPLQQLLRRYGAITPPYSMSTQALKQAIKRRSEVVRHEEFFSSVMSKRDAELLELYLETDRTIASRLDQLCGIVYPGSSALVSKLLARGLDGNRPDWLGKTFLHACAEQGNRSVAALFLDAGADINAREIEFQGTPLAAAVRAVSRAADSKQAKRGRRMVEFFLKRGAATNLPGDEPWATPLAWARVRGLAEIEQVLTKHGATS